MSKIKQRVLLIVTMVALGGVSCQFAIATDRTDDPVESGDRETLTEIPMEAVPEPPAEVDRLLSLGGISFRYGPRALLGRDEPNLVSNRRRTFVAETRFHLKYIYHSQTRWRVEEEDDQRQLIIQVSYESIETTFTHDVWFLEKPPTEAFWDDRLVRHELDHIRISTNPLIERTFKEHVRRDDRLMETIKSSTEVTESMVRGIVKHHVQSIFDEKVELVRIRYRELDRVTDHGLRPIPIDSEPIKWMKLDEPLAGE